MSIIFNLLNTVINQLHALVGDWGIAIVFTTLVIRLCLLPLSFKQKSAMFKQQQFSKKIEEIKSKYNGDQTKQQEEMSKLSSESMKGMVGCLVTLLQIPIMYSLYRVFSDIPVEMGSIIVPWISNLKLPDSYHIIPFIAVVVQLLPSMITVLAPVKSARENGVRWPQLLIMGGMSMFFFAKAPVTLGIYWITSGLFSAFETILYKKFMSRTAIE